MAITNLVEEFIRQVNTEGKSDIAKLIGDCNLEEFEDQLDRYVDLKSKRLREVHVQIGVKIDELSVARSTLKLYVRRLEREAIDARVADDVLYHRLVERQDFYEAESHKDGGVPEYKQGGASYPDTNCVQYRHSVTSLGYRDRVTAIEKGEMGDAEREFLTGRTAEELDAIFTKHSFMIPFKNNGMKDTYFALFEGESKANSEPPQPTHL